MIKKNNYFKKIELINIQRHEKLVVDFVKGSNVIVGVSNAGKSAVLKALRWVFTNNISTDAIRKTDSDRSVVIVTYRDGSKVTKIRSKKENKYILEVDGVEEHYESVGKDVPKDVINFTGMSNLVIDGEKFFVNEAKQGDLFLIGDDMKETTLGKFFDNITGNGVISSIFKSLNSKILSTNKEVKRLENSLNEKESKQLSVASQIKELSKKYDDSNEHVESLSKKYDNYLILKEKHSMISKLIKQVSDLNEEKCRLVNISTEEMNTLKDKVKNSLVIVDKIKDYSSTKNKLNESVDEKSKIKTATISNSLINKITKFDQLKKLLNNYILNKKQLGGAENKLSACCCDNIDVDKLYSSVNKKLDIISNLSKINDDKTNLLNKGDELKEVSDKLISANEEKQSILESLSVKCKECGNVLKYEDIKELI